MTAIELLNLLAKHAKEHRLDVAGSIKRNVHLTDSDEIVPQSVIDAVLVDFINSFAGEKYFIDYALSVEDLK